MDKLSIEEFKQALPKSLQRSVNPELVKQINDKLSDPDMCEMYRDNMIGYVSVMSQGRFKLASYVDAVKYVSLRLQDRTCIEAFSMTFPEKIQRWNLLNYAGKDIASNVTSYNKSKLVNLIYEQTLTPFWVINQDIYQKAINVQAELMVTAKSEKVRSDAANSLLTQLKPPEVAKVELDITHRPDSTIDALRQSTQQLVDMQQNMIENGAFNAQQIAQTPLKIINADADEEEHEHAEEAQFEELVPVAIPPKPQVSLFNNKDHIQ